jgi:hypothetical protein
MRCVDVPIKEVLFAVVDEHRHLQCTGAQPFCDDVAVPGSLLSLAAGRHRQQGRAPPSGFN